MDTNIILKQLKSSFRKSLLTQLRLLSTKYRIQKYRSKAAILIQKFMRGYRVRKDLNFIKPGKLYLLVKWQDPASSVNLVGNFTSPPWEVQVPLTFSKFLNLFISTYFADTALKPDRYYLKFIVDNSWLCNRNMPITTDMNSNENNLIEILKEKRFVPRPHSSRNLVPESYHMPATRQPKTEIPRVSSVEHNTIRPFKLHSQQTTKRLKLVFGSFMAAHPKTRFAPLESTSSADALLVDEELQIFGVADGVGEWETFGLDPGFFPKELMKYFKEAYQAVFSEIDPNRNVCNLLKLILSEAYNKTKSFGSSTVLLGAFQSNCLFTICLGDSTFIVLRPREKKGKLFEVFRLPEQQHSFNCPFQLARFPQPDQYEMLNKKGLGSFVSLLKRSNLEIQDKPQDAASENVFLVEGDILIAASDGLFDNLFDEDIIKIAEMVLGYELSHHEYCSKVAKELVCKAVQKGWDMTYKSPFSKNAARFGQRYIGGKLDDTTVVVGVVVEEL